MGNRPPRSKKDPNVAPVPPGMDLLAGNDGKVYLVKQHQAGCKKCTFWRADPRDNVLHFRTGDDYPRHGAVLRGMPIAHPTTGEPWLVVTHLAQGGGRGGWQYAPKGAALPFHSKAFLLHQVSVTL